MDISDICSLLLLLPWPSTRWLNQRMSFQKPVTDCSLSGTSPHACDKPHWPHPMTTAPRCAPTSKPTPTRLHRISPTADGRLVLPGVQPFAWATLTKPHASRRVCLCYNKPVTTTYLAHRPQAVLSCPSLQTQALFRHCSLAKKTAAHKLRPPGKGTGDNNKSSSSRPEQRETTTKSTNTKKHQKNKITRTHIYTLHHIHPAQTGSSAAYTLLGTKRKDSNLPIQPTSSKPPQKWPSRR